MEALRAQNTELSGKLDEQRRQLLALSKSRGGVPQEMLDAVMKERDEAKSLVTDLESQILDAKARVAALSKERDDLSKTAADTGGKVAEVDRLRAELTAAREEARKRTGKVSIPMQPASVVERRIDPPPRPVPPPMHHAPPPPSAMPATADLMEQTVVKVPAPKPAAHLGRPENSMTIKIEIDSVLLRKIIDTAPEALNGMRRHLHAFIKNQSETGLLEQLLLNLHSLTEATSQANLTSVHTMAYALEQLIADLMKIPGQINPSTLRTVSQSLDFLATLMDEKNLPRTKDPYLSNIFAVDDDHEARRVIRSAMEMVSLKVTCAEDPKTTLAVLNEQRFDLIFIDVGLPEMNGFDLCTKIRKLPEHKKTPVVFLTGAVTVQNRVQSSLSGGNDFIAKPFNLLELGVKALTWIFKGQLGLL